MCSVQRDDVIAADGDTLQRDSDVDQLSSATCR